MKFIQMIVKLTILQKFNHKHPLMKQCKEKKNKLLYTYISIMKQEFNLI